MFRQIPMLLGAAAIIAVSGPAFAQDSKPRMKDQDSKPMLNAMIEAKDQKADGKTVTIAKVTMPTDGFVVIHAVKDGKPVAPASIGHTAVKAGTHEDVDVELDYPAKAGEDYVAMLHADTGKKGEYEFGPDMTDVDKPIMMDGKPVIMMFKAN